ncbi:MAG: helix-turn-helix domain-containing protein [Lachnospiraceae bacterium]|nr:helix-turn-helix domain-containing protein [Lachnospiraceae bacterium]
MISSDDIKKNISKNITKYREKAGFSQRELAQQLGITPSRISNWEQGANCPTIDILFEVCKTLHVSINDIYGVYPDSEMMLSYSEQQHIQKYRSLDDRGRETVDITLERETIRVYELQKKEARIRELEHT